MSTLKSVIENGARLLSEEGENEEYDRAIIELVAAVLCIAPDEYESLAIILRGLKQ